ncbi:hypothetical protein BN1088_50003 [Sphingobacterium sp. PM2-P1-29]|nr:hypothetical protein BN1088_50003 [Sphingobacterium sp. PM2-P1-29]
MFKKLAHITIFSTFASLSETDLFPKRKDSVAQLVEQYTFNVWVLGSNPSGITKKSFTECEAFFVSNGMRTEVLGWVRPFSV